MSDQKAAGDDRDAFPFALTVLFQDAEMLDLFASYLSDGGGEAGAISLAERELGLDAEFIYHDADGAWLPDSTIRVKTNQEADNAE